MIIRNNHPNAHTCSQPNMAVMLDALAITVIVLEKALLLCCLRFNLQQSWFLTCACIYAQACVLATKIQLPRRQRDSFSVYEQSYDSFHTDNLCPSPSHSFHHCLDNGLFALITTLCSSSFTILFCVTLFFSQHRYSCFNCYVIISCGVFICLNCLVGNS